MALRTIAYLKALFITGSKPKEQDYHDLMDSYVHKDDVETINSGVINSAITAYDTALKSVNVDGVPDTLGDVLAMLSGFTDDVDVKTYIDSLGIAPNWGTIAEKPTDVRVVWSDQAVSTDSYAPGYPSSITNVPIQSIAALGSGELVQTSGRYLVKDILISRVSFRTDSSVLGAYYADRIRSVVYAVQPRVNLT